MVLSSPSIDPITAWTLSAWIKRSTTGTQREGILEKYDRASARGNYALRIQNNKLIAYIINGQTGQVCGITSTTLTS